MTVYRGLRLSNQQVSHLLARVGKRLSTRSHAWWATVRGIAIAYATSPAVRLRANSHILSPVLLTAELIGYEPTTPTLPDLRLHRASYLTLIDLELM